MALLYSLELLTRSSFRQYLVRALPCSDGRRALGNATVVPCLGSIFGAGGEQGPHVIHAIY